MVVAKKDIPSTDDKGPERQTYNFDLSTKQAVGNFNMGSLGIILASVLGFIIFTGGVIFLLIRRRKHTENEESTIPIEYLSAMSARTETSFTPPPIEPPTGPQMAPSINYEDQSFPEQTDYPYPATTMTNSPIDTFNQEPTPNTDSYDTNPYESDLPQEDQYQQQLSSQMQDTVALSAIEAQEVPEQSINTQAPTAQFNEKIDTLSPASNSEAPHSETPATTPEAIYDEKTGELAILHNR